MSFGEGNLRERVVELECENYELRKVECPCHDGKGYTECVAFRHADKLTRKLADEQMHELANQVLAESISEYERIEDARTKRIAELEQLLHEYHECLVEHHRAHQVPHRIAVEWMAARLEKLGIEVRDGD